MHFNFSVIVQPYSGRNARHRERHRWLDVTEIEIRATF
jgi:hypothetical protein